MSADEKNQYFADGQMEAILNHLSKIRELRVISRNTMDQYRETTKTTPEIAKELNVSYILEGSVQKSGNEVRITTQLIEGSSDTHLWSENYTLELKEIFSIQTKIAIAVVKEIRAQLTPEEAQILASVPTDNIEAYNLYLQGRHFWIQEGKDNLDKSIAYYQQALALDSNFALAYSGMATTYNSFGWYLYLPNIEVIPQAKKAAMKALEMDNSLAEAHTELAFAQLLLDWDWSESEKEFKVAIELNPNYARAHNLYAWLLTDIGRHAEAIEESKRAHDLDPLAVIKWVNVGRRYYFARDYDRAIDVYRKVLEIFPNNKYSSVSYYARSQLALALSLKGSYKEAFEEYSKTDYEPIWYSFIGYTYGVTGNREKAMEKLNHYLELSKKELVWNGSIAIIYIGLGEKDKAFEWLDKAYEQREGWLTVLKVDPLFDSLRSDFRFQDLLERMNFPD